MAKIQNISEIHPTLGFTEFDILEKYRKSFKESELGRLHSVFPFECMAKAESLSDPAEHIQSFRQDSPYGPEGLYRVLRQTFDTVMFSAIRTDHITVRPSRFDDYLLAYII